MIKKAGKYSKMSISVSPALVKRDEYDNGRCDDGEYDVEVDGFTIS